MRTAAIALVLALAGAVVSQSAEAHRGHSHVSIGVGFGYWGPYWGPYWGAPWWYYPPAPVYYPVVPSQPVTYIEKGSSESAPAANTNDGGNWWYYCDASKGYYPYVKECPGGWQRVSPTPPSTK